jgi:hypothetical protein
VGILGTQLKKSRMRVTIAHGVISPHALSVRGTEQFHKLNVRLQIVLGGALYDRWNRNYARHT